MNEKELAKICNKSTSDCIELAKQLKEAQQRIDKAIEYIENHFLYHYGSEKRPIVFEDNYIQEIVDILRGEDNE